MAPAHTNGSLTRTADRPAPPALSPGDGDGHAGRLFYQELFEFAFDGQLVTDPHGVILDANQAAAALFRCPKEFLMGKPLGVLVAAADRATFYNHLLRLPSTSTTLLDVRVGGIRASRANVVAMVAPAAGEAGGRPATYRWVLRDVTGARRAEQELLWERELLQGVVDGADAIILVVDPNGRILRSNPYLHDVSGFEGSDLSGQPWCDMLLAPADRPAGWRVLGQAVAHRSARTGPLGLRTRHGAERWVVWSARGLHAQAEAGVVLVGQDITDLKEAQAKALQAERLAAIGQMVAGLAHESRNALQRSQACLEMLALRLDDRPEGLDLIARVQRAQDDLHRLYEEVRDYAAPIWARGRARRDLAAVWREAWADLAAAAGGGEAALAEARRAADAECVADPFRLRQVFRNIFENALAACPAPVRMRHGPLRHRRPWAGRPVLRVAVRDNGPGLDRRAAAGIFEPFYTTKTKGTGLGMAIAQRIVEAHGGRIAAGRRRAAGRDRHHLTQEHLMRAMTAAAAHRRRRRRARHAGILPRDPAHAGPRGRRRGRDRRGTGRAVPGGTRPTWSSPTSRCPTWTASTRPPRRTGTGRSRSSSCPAYHDPELFERAAADHVMAYLVKPIKQADLEPAIAMAMRRFEQFQALRREAADLRQALEDRKIIERAKGAVTRRVGVPEDDAYRLMHKMASDNNKKMVDVARQILTAEETFRSLEEVPAG